MSFEGKKNIYVCDKCSGHIVTVDLVEGVTPFTTGCKATPGCKGVMRSSMYRVFDQSMKASHEWYKPDARELAMEPNAAVVDHVERGGLLLREASS